MATKPRVESKTGVYLVSNFCFQGRSLLRPDGELNRVAMGCLAHSAWVHQVKIYGFVFLPGSFFLIVGAEFLNLSNFMRDFQSPLAMQTNLHRKRGGKLFRGRYHAEPILDARAFWEQLTKMYMRPVEERWVRTPGEWTGVSSFGWHGKIKARAVEYLNLNVLRMLREKDPDAAEGLARDTFALRLAAPPKFSGLDALKVDNVREKIDQMTREATEKWEALREEKDQRIIGVDEMMRWSWSAVRTDLKRYRPSLCHAAREEKRKDFEARLQRIWKEHGEAMRRYREGHPKPCFPHGTYQPGYARCTGAPEKIPPPNSADRGAYVMDEFEESAGG